MKRWKKINEKVKKEYDYLKIGIDKTGGEREKLAWSWIEEKIEGYFKK